MDIIDESIENLKRYNRELILNDPSLSKQLEDYLARREAVENGEKEMDKALAEGKDYIEVSNQDLLDFNEMIYQDKEEDKDVLRTTFED